MESNRLQQIDLTAEDQELIFSRAIEKIKNGKMRELDPTLGDQGCHLRACPLVFVADKVLQDQELTPEEKAFLISLETTMFNTLDMVANNGFFLFNKSYNNKIPTYLKGTYSNTKKAAIISRYRVQASKLSMTFLAQKAAQLLPKTEMTRELKAAFANDVKSVVRDKETLKIPPFYSTFMMILEILLTERYPVVLIIQEYNKIDDKAIKLEKTTPFYYEPNAERTEYQFNQVPNHNKPALCVHAFTMYDNPEKSTSNLDRFFSKIRTTDLVQVLTAFAAAHGQYPNISEEDKLASFEKEGAEGLLKEKYQKSVQLAKALNFTSERLNKKTNTFMSELTINEVFQAVHIYCSNYGTEARKCEEFNKEEILSTKVAINLDQGKATYQNL